MSVRRCLTALVIATVAAACAAPAATAKTKVVFAGGPPPKAGQAGTAKFPAALDLNGFFRRKATIHVGDSVRWVFSKRVVHTVTFLAPGQTRPPSSSPIPRTRTPASRLHRRAVLVQRAAEPADPARPRLPAGRADDGRHGVPQLRPVGPGVHALQAQVHEEGQLQVHLPRASRDGRQREGAAEARRRPVGPGGSPRAHRRVREGGQARPRSSPSSSPRATTWSPATTTATWRGSGSSRPPARSRPASPCTSRSPRSRRSTR